ncbi:LysR family transcriptional regulator [Nocardia sp. alder85J]|uniref:LysR family transcriptional regulator n=1 Tax=Nocardia sp. alder85J TaxID=2862949 RepID=UPI001CD36120|nr:LysR substrate-binding domain-containing protein [Nocardia sp. alder85J]MCX4095547.1 LysR substrate-binding domain-containing protein [Nocardia sp. alder85J]
MGTFNRLHLIRQVDLFTLRLFLSAIEERQIGLAAIRENIAPSTATKRIQMLEDIAGVELLERGPKGVVPSAAGLVLERCARSIFGDLDAMRSEIALLTGAVRGELSIVSARTIIVPLLARVIGEFGGEYPQVELALEETENADVVRRVARGDADLGVFAAAHHLDLSGVDVTPYRQDRLVAVVPPNHALATRDAVGFRELAAGGLIAPSSLLGAFRAAAVRLGMEFGSPHRVRSGEVAIGLVQAGLGVTVVPECLLDYALLSRVAVLDFDEHWAVRHIHLATPSARPKSPATRAFIAQLLDRPLDGDATVREVLRTPAPPTWVILTD